MIINRFYIWSLYNRSRFKKIKQFRNYLTSFHEQIKSAIIFIHIRINTSDKQHFNFSIQVFSEQMLLFLMWLSRFCHKPGNIIRPFCNTIINSQQIFPVYFFYLFSKNKSLNICEFFTGNVKSPCNNTNKLFFLFCYYIIFINKFN